MVKWEMCADGMLSKTLYVTDGVCQEIKLLSA